jgi:hypothetical protein
VSALPETDGDVHGSPTKNRTAATKIRRMRL